MPLIRAWVCPETGKLFRSITDYRSHLRKQVAIRFKRRAKEAAAEAFNACVAELHKLAQIDHIEEWVMDNQQVLFAHNLPNEDSPKLVSFKLGPMQWTEKLDQTHYAPVGKKADFLGGLPAIPGHTGKVTYVYENMRGIFDFLEDTGLNICNGGGVGGKITMRIDMFDEDFPYLALMDRLRLPL